MELKILKVKYGRKEIEIPYYEIIGKKDGKMGFISAGVHGNEINGINIVRNFVRIAKMTELEKKLHGVLLVFPVLNPTGFLQMKRRVPEDHRDLNRQFGKKTVDSISSAIAFELTHQFFKKCDFGIDFHDSGSPLIYLPHTRIHKTKEERESLDGEIARVFGTKIIFQRKGYHNMMAVAMKEQFGTPVVTVEVAGAQMIFQEYVKSTIGGIRNVLSYYRMIDHKVKLPKRQYKLLNRYGVVVTEGGMINLKVELGDKIHAGEKLGIVYYPESGREEPIISNMCGTVFSKRITNQVKKGQTIFSVLEEKPCHTMRKTLDNFEVMQGLEIHKIRL